jgi:hypothetical protein
VNIHLIRTGNVDDITYTGVYEFLKQTSGPYNFFIQDIPEEIDELDDDVKIVKIGDEGFHIQEKMKMNMDSEIEAVSYSRIERLEQYSWNDLLAPCKKYRKKHALKTEDIVILLTDIGNHRNWFTGYDESGASNFFVHTQMWDYYIDGDIRYPISYQIATLLLKNGMFQTPKQLFSSFHKKSRGCMMDFCERKEEITLKMRTADICSDCQKHIQKAEVPFQYIRYTLDIMEAIRKQLLFKERYGMLKQSASLFVKGHLKHLYIPELGMLKINLTPLERSVYLLFLNHPEGIKLSEISKHRTELSALVHQLSRSEDKQVIESGINSLCQSNSNSLSEKLARIKSKFEKHLGNDLAVQYIISGPNGGEKKINLESNKIIFKD